MSQLEYGRFDTSSIPGFAIAIDATPLPPSHSPDYITYLVSVSGPIFPSSTCSTSVEYLNDDTIFAYFGTHAQGPPPYPHIECTITHRFIHTKPNGTFLDLPPPTTPAHAPSTVSHDVQVFKYKPIVKKVRPITATLPEEFQATHQIIGDLLAGMPKLLPHPPDYAPTSQYDEAAHNIINTNHPGDFLLPEE